MITSAIAVTVVAAVVAVIVLLRQRFVVVQVIGVSMEPVLRAGQRVLVRRAGVRTVRRGDLVVFALASVQLKQPGDPPWMVKRAVALSGDPIPHESVPPALGVDGAHVPEGHLIVRGDNPAASFDSRQAGFVDGAALLGVVVRTLA
ncbi:MAG: S26 family signal peptidase [Pseudonocardia sp.]|nr:S26 family signal peptidase [Pseudonocardia sp.]